MAVVKYLNYLTRDYSTAFDQIHDPGARSRRSGIYRCEGCGLNVISMKDSQLPPPNHHEHRPVHGTIRWRLIVAAD